jgi:cell division septation protein DedD
MSVNLKNNFTPFKLHFGCIFKIIFVLILALTLTSCSTSLQSRVAGNLNQFSKQNTLAILPVEIIKKDQKETAHMLRQGLYAHLKESKFNLLERYIVDGLLKKHNLNNPADFLKINPMQFAEILGADAVLISRINRVERSYLVVHSSIEIGVSAQLVDTRTGEILWRAEQTEQDYQGLAKIPTGISSAILGPIQFVTNKLNLRRLTSQLVTKLTAIVKNPANAEKKETFEEPLIASRSTRDLEKIKTVNKLETKWVEGSVAYTEVPLSTETQKNLQDEPVSARQRFVPITEVVSPKHINWTPRKPGAESVQSEPQVRALQQSKALNKTSNILPIQASTLSNSLQYTVQVGAFKTEKNANQMVSKLLKKGYRAHIKSEIKNGIPFFKVRFDGVNNKSQAVKLAEKFTSKENISSFITITHPN